MAGGDRYVYDIEQADEGPGLVCISLVRRRERASAQHLRHHVEVLDSTVLYSRSFRPLLERVAMQDYEARLVLVARHAEEGRFGCFAETRSGGGTVEVALYERSFDGAEIRTEELARQAFVASDEDSLVASAEFLADLRVWADRRNDEREAERLEERDADQARRLVAAEREAATNRRAARDPGRACARHVTGRPSSRAFS